MTLDGDADQRLCVEHFEPSTKHDQTFPLSVAHLREVAQRCSKAARWIRLARMTIRFPNESDVYRAARADLLKAEAELRDHVERVAAQRRKLPLGGKVKEDYVFDETVEGEKRQTRMSELFADDKDTLFLYGFMYGPKAEAPCPLCTSFLDSLNGSQPHISQRINLAVSARAPIDRITKLASSRGWDNLRLLSSSDNSFQSDYFAETEKHGQMPMANVFVRRDGVIHHFWGSELLYGPSDADSRHIDLMWPLWNVFDTTPDGRSADWYPKLKY
jgi:predicted dithiol-disulfide oxidoreductase (DUF899 family)